MFRAILLGCMKPLKSGAEIIMEEFYKDHSNDPDTKGKVVLDPFMGGGTTVVEALRLGCKVIGIDLNPVAWFIVKTEVEPVDIEELRSSFERLAERKVTWSGKSVRETLLDQYKTECPCCGAGREEADITYTFWVKSAICTNPLCKKEVPLFSDYIIAAKSPPVKWHNITFPFLGNIIFPLTTFEQSYEYLKLAKEEFPKTTQKQISEICDSEEKRMEMSEEQRRKTTTCCLSSS
ncbi:MAG: hypothetical protein J7J76_07455 [Candidatus Latescibacteria bacterium]|nr:hypothetical protein [Candidatus Latescibacterota bacterium]